MLEIHEDLDALGHDVVGAVSVEIGDEPDAAGIVFEALVVESVHHGFGTIIHSAGSRIEEQVSRKA
jgi:hypothetical protein